MQFSQPGIPFIEKSLYIFLLLLLSLTACAPAWQQQPDTRVTPGDGKLHILIPAKMQIESINGKKFAQTSLFRSKQELKLLPGNYRIHGRYIDFFKSNATEPLKLRSEIMIFSVEGKANETVRLAFASNSGGPAPTGTVPTTGWSHNLTSGQRVEAEIQDPSALYAADTVQTALYPEVSDIQPQNKSGQDSMEILLMLKVYWKQASHREKRAFLQWISTDS